MSRSSLDVILAAVAEPVMITDADGVITYANPAGVRRFAWDKVIGVSLQERVARWPMRKPDRTAVSVGDDPVACALAGRTSSISGSPSRPPPDDGSGSPRTWSRSSRTESWSVPPACSTT
jgi:PAS domain-containing protein